MRFKHMGWLRQSLTEAETEKTPLQTILPVNVTFVTESLGVNEPLDFKRGS